MSFTIPNGTLTTDVWIALDQAEPDQVDFEALASGNAVLEGCGVTSNSSASSVAVASGAVLVKGVHYLLAGQPTLSLTSTPEARFDLIVARLSGGNVQLVVLEGVPSGTNPTYPRSAQSAPASSNNFNPAIDTLLAAVFRQPSAVILSGHIVDKRIISGRFVRFDEPSTAGFGFVLDEGTLSSNSSTKVPTQQSVKSYVDSFFPVSTANLGNGAVTTDKVVNDAITNAKLRNSSALSVIGRSANSTGDPGDIAASTNGHVLRRSGTSLGFGTVASAGLADNAVTTTKIANNAVTDAKAGPAVGSMLGSSGVGNNWAVYRRFGSLVTVQGWRGLTGTSLTLPAGYRPAYLVTGPIVGGTNLQGVVNITTGGVITATFNGGPFNVTFSTE